MTLKEWCRNMPKGGLVGNRPGRNKEHGRRKFMVSMWFKNGTNLVMMIDLLKIMKEELEKAACKIDGQNVKGRLESQFSEVTLAKGACFVLQGTQGDEKETSLK